MLTPAERSKLIEEIRKWEHDLKTASDSGIQRWIAFHIVLLKKELAIMEE
jgi:hypothetical protein